MTHRNLLERLVNPYTVVTRTLFAALLMLSGALGACGEERGPVEQLVDDVEDVVDQPGPVERAGEEISEGAAEAGEAVDRAAEDVREGAEEVGQEIQRAVD